jgi:hypothetical protein
MNLRTDKHVISNFHRIVVYLTSTDSTRRFDDTSGGNNGTSTYADTGRRDFFP